MISSLLTFPIVVPSLSHNGSRMVTSLTVPRSKMMLSAACATRRYLRWEQDMPSAAWLPSSSTLSCHTKKRMEKTIWPIPKWWPTWSAKTRPNHLPKMTKNLPKKLPKEKRKIFTTLLLVPSFRFYTSFCSWFDLLTDLIKEKWNTKDFSVFR